MEGRRKRGQTRFPLSSIPDYSCGSPTVERVFSFAGLTLSDLTKGPSLGPSVVKSRVSRLIFFVRERAERYWFKVPQERWFSNCCLVNSFLLTKKMVFLFGMLVVIGVCRWNYGIVNTHNPRSMIVPRCPTRLSPCENSVSSLSPRLMFCFFKILSFNNFLLFVTSRNRVSIYMCTRCVYQVSSTMYPRDSMYQVSSTMCPRVSPQTLSILLSHVQHMTKILVGLL